MTLNISIEINYIEYIKQSHIPGSICAIRKTVMKILAAVFIMLKMNYAVMYVEITFISYFSG